jgi:hypothetical protein
VTRRRADLILVLLAATLLVAVRYALELGLFVG